MHTLIVGNSDADMTLLTDRLLAECADGLPIYGFRTFKDEEDDTGSAPIYIYPASGEPLRTPENLLGWCKNKSSDALPEAFERFAEMLERAPGDGVILMDELGSMESRSPRFRAAVMSALAGDAPVLAAVRDKDTPFLSAVRAVPNARCFFVTAATRDGTFPEAAEFFKKQLSDWRIRNVLL